MNRFRNIIRLGLVPVVATGGTAGFAQGVNAQAPEAVVGLAPAGARVDTLCQPFYGSGKEIGVAVTIEDADGELLTSLDGYEFELRHPDYAPLEIAVGTGTTGDQPANISLMTASVVSAGVDAFGFFQPPVFWLNCFPPDPDSGSFPEGTTLVALKDGTEVSSGSLAGRFPPRTIPSDIGLVMAGDVAGIFSGVPCDAAAMSTAYRDVVDLFGLTRSAELTDKIVGEYVDNSCPVGADFYFLNQALSQAFFNDAPRGLLAASVVIPASTTLDWASLGHVEAARLDAPETDLLVAAGSRSWIGASLGAALAALGVALRRRSALRHA